VKKIKTIAIIGRRWFDRVNGNTYFVEVTMPSYGCYTLDLYCDRDNADHEYGEFPNRYTGHSQRKCISYAKRDGWRFDPSGTVICPQCAKAQNNANDHFPNN
jgi:hypothetical protein